MPLQTVPAAKASPTHSAVDCRVRERHPCELETSCQPVAARGDNDLHWPGTIRDISTAGVGVVLKRRFEPGAGLAIELPSVGDRDGETLLARVRHATRLQDGHWLHGCAFISELSDDELYALLRLSARGQTPAPDARMVGANVVRDVTFRGVTADGQRVALLVRQLRTRAAWPLAPGTSLAVRVGGPSAGQVRLVVEEAAEHGGRWTVRCRFLSGPHAEVVRSAGKSTKA
jgi:hypothetical protein